MSPNSSSVTLIWRSSVARIVPSVIGSSYDLPVRLSMMVRVSAPPSPACAAPVAVC